jgi:predicted membrane-bound spermidine synthase
MPQRLVVGSNLRFLTSEVLASLANFPADMARVETGMQTLMTQNLVHYYEKEWHRATR